MKDLFKEYINDDPMIASLFEAYLLGKGHRVGWSSLNEVIIEYLADEGWMSEPVDYIEARYDVPRPLAKRLVEDIRWLGQILREVQNECS